MVSVDFSSASVGHVFESDHVFFGATAQESFRHVQTLEGLAAAWSHILDVIFPDEEGDPYYPPEVIFEIERLYRELWRMLGGDQFLY